MLIYRFPNLAMHVPKINQIRFHQRIINLSSNKVTSSQKKDILLKHKHCELMTHQNIQVQFHVHWPLDYWYIYVFHFGAIDNPPV